MFVVAQGNIHGFNFTGPFETEIAAEQWLLTQFDCSGNIIGLTSRPSGGSGTTILIFGDPINGFVLIGTFSNRLTAEAYRKESRSIAWVTDLKEVEPCL